MMTNDTSILLTLGEVIKTLRKKKRLSQQALADNAGIHRNYVISLEKGRQNPSLLVLFSIAKALTVKPNKIINLINNQTVPV